MPEALLTGDANTREWNTPKATPKPNARPTPESPEDFSKMRANIRGALAMNDPPTAQDLEESSRLWGQLSNLRDPQDPLDLFGKINAHKMHAFQFPGHGPGMSPNDLAIHITSHDPRRPAPDPSNPAPTTPRLTQEQYNAPIHQFHHYYRSIAPTTYFNGDLTHGMLYNATGRDLKMGFRYPGGMQPAHAAAGNINTVYTTVKQTMAFARDLADSSNMYHDYYPPGTHAMERVGGETVVLLNGGPTGTFRVEGKKEHRARRDYRYVREWEVDWDAVAAAGGMGDLVLVEDDNGMFEDSKKEKEEFEREGGEKRRPYDERYKD